MRLLHLLLLPVVLVAMQLPVAAEVPRVVATIKPIHSLVAAVMGPLGTPELIVDGAASPHAYSLRPSDAAALSGADIVFWTGAGLELFLAEALETLAVEATVVELAATPGLELLPAREGGAFEAHAHAHDGGHDHATGEEGEQAQAGDPGTAVDMHFWLDPRNGARLGHAIAAILADADPANAATYSTNAAALAADLAALEEELAARLAPVADVPFIAFHDAYHYVEHRFGLTAAGTLTVTPDAMPGARRVRELRERIATSGAACVFAEPQFEPAIVGTMIEGTGARAGELDPEGAGLIPGPELYRQLLEGLAAGLADCLSASPAGKSGT